jgi:hypothetical protein
VVARRPITRLMKSFSPGRLTPTRSPSVSPIRSNNPPGASSKFSGAHRSVPRKTTTSPRSGSRTSYKTLLTRTRSPISRVCSIELDGIKKACTRNERISTATQNATTSSSGNSCHSGIGLRSARHRRRVGCHGASARPVPPRGHEPAARSRAARSPRVRPYPVPGANSDGWYGDFIVERWVGLVPGPYPMGRLRAVLDVRAAGVAVAGVRAVWVIVRAFPRVDRSAGRQVGRGDVRSDHGGPAHEWITGAPRLVRRRRCFVGSADEAACLSVPR